MLRAKPTKALGGAVVILNLSKSEVYFVCGGSVCVECVCPLRPKSYWKACFQTGASGAATAASLYQAGLWQPQGQGGGQQYVQLQQPQPQTSRALLVAAIVGVVGCFFGILAEWAS